VAVVAASMLAAAAALPWARSGEATRNAYSLARATDNAGLSHGVNAVLGSLVFLFPLLAAVAVTLSAFHAIRAAAWTAAFTGTAGFLAAYSVLQSSFKARPGAIIAAGVAAVAAVAGVIAGLWRPQG